MAFTPHSTTPSSQHQTMLEKTDGKGNEKSRKKSLVPFDWLPITQNFIDMLTDYDYWSVVKTKLAILSACPV
ncbi:MAG: hypothetical protein Athens101428_741 [Candidatus Berkelbacteria bacterium Athens1014_28]|uniref:Uncharacterized protein n=1 Tax=Candidatus Berkelbacteria bacterium Athens1014_28 TaxID=2017145 RepID=A0A554LJU2_9BACT|nr:MAG: hypothetical protein Athens101428_741 [Candidatus Berkelbacteria bacterium Athens1014_28]